MHGLHLVALRVERQQIVKLSIRQHHRRRREVAGQCQQRLVFVFRLRYASIEGQDLSVYPPAAIRPRGVPGAGG